VHVLHSIIIFKTSSNYFQSFSFGGLQSHPTWSKSGKEDWLNLAVASPYATTKLLQLYAPARSSYIVLVLDAVENLIATYRNNHSRGTRICSKMINDES